MKTSSPTYEAVVEKIVPTGKHGPYCVSRCEKLNDTVVTFSLDPPVWTEEEWPEEGTYVVLTEVRKKRAGWRASKARFMRPEDKISTANQQPRNPRKE